jgi:hypothetical protein
MMLPRWGCALRMRSSRFALRRSNSRRADAPAIPGVEHRRFRILDARLGFLMFKAGRLLRSGVPPRI